MAVDGHGDVFVADTYNHRVQEWAPGATQGITVAGGHGPGAGANQLWYPVNAALDGHGNVFVADPYNSRVQRVTLPMQPNPAVSSTTAVDYYNTTSDSPAPPVHTGQQVVLAAMVIPSAGIAPRGTVAFFDGTADLGAVPLSFNPAISHTILFTVLGQGTHTITARYLGDATHTPSDATPIAIVVVP